jgi:hypothetical protein
MEIYEFRAAYPEFDDIDDQLIASKLELFTLIYGVGFGSLVDHMQGLYTAHTLTLSKKSQSGIVTSKSVGDVSVTYADKAGNSQLYQTRYGEELAQLLISFAKPLVSSANA